MAVYSFYLRPWEEGVGLCMYPSRSGFSNCLLPLGLQHITTVAAFNPPVTAAHGLSFSSQFHSFNDMFTSGLCYDPTCRRLVFNYLVPFF